jgi:alkylation response protein AidB-like acyl-CoA dehydrogenase
VQFDLTPEQRAFRDDLRSWLQVNVPTGLKPAGTAEGFAQHVAWEKQLVAAGYGAIHWPVAYGGRGAGPVEQAIFEEEYLRAGGPERVTVVGHNLFGPTLMRHGTPEQRDRWLPGVLSADVIWSQGYSEPDAGSDLAALSTRADRDGDHLVVNGQKIWTSHGVFADWIFALVRTDASGRKHDGITMLAIDLGSDGIEVRPIRQLDGHTGFAEVFFTDVRVPVDQVIGDIGDGWRVAMTALEFERDAPAAAPARYHRDLQELCAIVRARGLDGDDVVRDQLGRLAAEVDAYEHHAERTLATLVAGGDLGPASSLTKLAWSELERDLYTTGRELLGPAGEHLDALPGLADPDGWRTRYWYARAATIYAGTSEIQKGIIAQRVLGLPRTADAEPRDAVALPVDVRFSEEQLALRDVARELFAKVSSVTRLRDLHDGADPGTDAWQQIVDVGLTGIGVPAELGGLGGPGASDGGHAGSDGAHAEVDEPAGNATDLVLVLEEAGRACLPEPLASTMAVAVPVLSASDTDQAAEVLRAIAAGSATVGTWLADEPTLVGDAHGWILREHDDSLLLLPADALRDVRAVPSEDGTRRLVQATIDPAAGTVLGGPDLVVRARTLAAAATAAELVGVCAHLFDQTLAYAKLRRQFESPIGAFQAVAHELAELFVLLESARGAARHAARRIAADGDDASRAAHVAKAAANEAARRIETSALQLHGGIGFTWEHDLHLWLKRALALQARHGDTRTHRRALAAMVLHNATPEQPMDDKDTTS